MPANQVREIFNARIKQLMAQYEGSKALTHPTTIGTMRENYLKNFLRDLLPQKFNPVTGFICDLYGNITPQLDMIFIDQSELPTITLVNDTVIVPYEIALLIGEVKSTITTETIAQIKEWREAINKMQGKILMASSQPVSIQPRNRPQTIGTFLIAFKSDVSEKTLKQWVENWMGEPAGICVIDSNGETLSIFSQIVAADRQIDTQKAAGPEPLLTFVGMIYRWLYYLLLANSTMSDDEMHRYWNTHATFIWEGYLSEFLYDHLVKTSETPN